MKSLKKPNFKALGTWIGHHKKLTVLLAIILVLGILIASCTLKMGANGENVSSVVTDQAAIDTITKTLSAEGEIKPATEENITPHTGWKVKEVLVQAGQAAAEGDVLLTYTNGKNLTAPYDCVVEKMKLPETKEAVTNDHYLRLGSTDTLLMELSVKENELPLVKIGQKAKIKVSATDKSYDGRVTFISDLGSYKDSGSSFAVSVTFPNDGSLKLGMSGHAKIVLAKAKDVVVVPLDAVQYKDDNNEEAFVTVIKEDGTTEDVDVVTGISNKKFIEIKKGLKGNETLQYFPSDDGDDMMFYGY